MALLDLLSFFYNDFKYRFAFFSFAFNKNTLAVGRRSQPQRHFVSAVRTFYFSNKLTFLKKYNKTAPCAGAVLLIFSLSGSLGNAVFNRHFLDNRYVNLDELLVIGDYINLI